MDGEQIVVKTIIEQCLSLTKRERVILINKLNDSIQTQEKLENVVNRGWKIIRIVEEVCNIKFDFHSREHRFFLGRCLVCNQLLTEGYTTTQVGKALKKDHSTIIHMRGYINDLIAFPRMAQDDFEYYKEFKRRMNNDIQ